MDSSPTGSFPPAVIPGQFVFAIAPTALKIPGIVPEVPRKECLRAVRAADDELNS